ncbi:hypothetical protein [Actinoplanes sp. NPDC051494]|uniref:hypothetical protein n=1 Tax=Actinoplanes sp. NPDC051494 TaxID=3363907 RepID=UPI0037BC7FCC
MTTTPPRIAVLSVAFGLLLMSLFTVAWTGNTFAAWPLPAAWTAFGVGLALAALFITTGVRLFRARRHFRTDLSADDKQVRKSTGRTFGLVFGAEGLAIWLAALILGATGNEDYIVPAIALIVGLHFYPMARIFDRRVDLYLATWTCLVALTGIVLLATTDLEAAQISAAVAIGAALATATYGLYMTRLATDLLSRVLADRA